MNWKDWLYIPKSDKIAIVSLAILIAVLLLILFAINHRDKEDSVVVIPEDYKEWQARLMTKKEEEKQQFIQKHQKEDRIFQPKMKQGETIELNTADTTLLKMIPGIGSGYANRIVNYRNSLGGFVKIEQLGEVWGMDTYLYSQILPYLTLEPEYAPLYINRLSFKELLKHPYLNYKQASAIDDIRTRKGAIHSMNRLQMLDEFKKKDIDRLKDYISFEE